MILAEKIGNGRTECYWCKEGGDLVSGMHRECGIRSVMGSTRCQMDMCSRLGGPGCGDDPRLTKREAAIEAYNYWVAHPRN